MEDSVRFRGIRFDGDFQGAVRDDGLTVRLTRSERGVAMALVRSAGAVLSRERLLDALSGPGSDSADRNIDFVINRLRRKLGDDARSPDFIATHYGEGYSWIAPKLADRPAAAGAFLVVGPVRGMKRIGRFVALAETFARDLTRALDEKTANDRPVALDPDCPPPDGFQGEMPRFAVDLSFLVLGGGLDCIVTLKDFPSGRIVQVARQTVEAGGNAARALAEAFTDALWQAAVRFEAATEGPDTEPLFIRIRNASLTLATRVEQWKEFDDYAFVTNTESWQEADRRLRRQLEMNPDDHATMLALANNIHAKWVLSGHELFTGPDTREDDENEIERLVIGSLPHLQVIPTHRLLIAKLLFFLDRGYDRVAAEMAEDAFRSATSLATSLTIVGQMRMFLGEIGQALDCFAQATEMAEPGSEFYIYLGILKISAFKADGDREAAERQRKSLVQCTPELNLLLALNNCSSEPDQITPEVNFLLSRLSEPRARAILLYSHYILGRLFRLPDHRENFMSGFTTVLARRFGDDIVPDEIRQSVPGLFSNPLSNQATAS